jgi:hypothetical protein
MNLINRLAGSKVNTNPGDVLSITGRMDDGILISVNSKFVSSACWVVPIARFGEIRLRSNDIRSPLIGIGPYLRQIETSLLRLLEMNVPCGNGGVCESLGSGGEEDNETQDEEESYTSQNMLHGSISSDGIYKGG